MRNIGIIGEAAGRIQATTPSFAVEYSELPWIEMRGIRNKIILEYFDVDWDVVRATVNNDLPLLKQQILNVLSHGHQPPDKGDADEIPR